MADPLAERVRRGDPAAFGVFVGRYLAGAHSVAARWPTADTEAVVRSAFSELLRGEDPVVSLFAAILSGCRRGPLGVADGELGERLAGLPEELREVVLLRDVAGLPIGTVAAVLGLPRSSAQARLHRAREALVG